MSARRLVALCLVAALAGVATAQAVAKPPAKHGTAKKRRAAKKQARAVKLAQGVAWVPPAIVNASRPPLTGASASGGTASGGGGGGAGPGGAPGGGTGTTTTTTTTTPTGPPAQQALGATVDERNGYSLRLSRAALASGTVVVQLINQGEDPHNLRIVRTDPSGGAPVDLPETGPQQQTTRTLTLTPGSYYLFCTLTTPVNHANAGMHATLRVDP